MRILKFSLVLLMLCSVFSMAEEYYLDQIILRLSDETRTVQPSITDGSWQFGLTDLDQICRDYQINLIEKIVPYTLNAEIWSDIDLDKVFIVHFPPEADLFKVIDDFNLQSSVMYAEPYFIRKMFFTPNDPYFGNQYGLNDSHTQAERAWDYCRGDASVKIAIIDSGMDMDHPDLAGNVWVNPGEDLNGNGIIEQSERNNIDDDSNGHIDDFYGWDFMYDDNDPNDDYPASQGGGHGTHCAGIASAQTNNGTGIASLGFDCSLITVRTGEGMYIYYGYQGIIYALDVQADVLSLSWGGGGYSQLEQDLFNQAYNNGSAVYAAAGNDDSNALQYPAAYNNVMAVASTNQNDLKSSFSNYGTWVDISAPGSSIFSTYLSGTYTTMSGTSMSCPFTAGLAGLVKAAFPNFQAEEINQVIMENADNIDNLNPSYAGMLGAGRINAYRALGMLYTPSLHIGDYELTDDGNNNGQADPGENVIMTVELSNGMNYQTASNIQAYLTCEDPGITITDNTSLYPDIAGGQSATNESDPFAFYISPSFNPGYVTFIVSLLAQPNNYALYDSLTMLVGVPQILLVDDDGGVNNFESFYTGPLNALDRGYQYWDNYSGYPMPEFINQYDIVIWFTGNAQVYTLDAYEQYILSDYLSNGGRLFLTGQYIGDEISTSSFYANSLHCSLQNPQVSNGNLLGVANHPISSGTSLLIVGTGGAGNGLNSPSAIIPNGGAEAMYNYSTGQTGALTYADQINDSKLVYMEFAFEAISGLGGPTALDRNELLDLILDWLEAPASVSEFSINTPSQFRLQQNYPNPFNPTTEVTFSLPHRMKADLSVFDVLGRKTAVLAAGELEAGIHTYSFKGDAYASGIYFAVLSTPIGEQRIKMVLVK